jgi:hypothetical protein
LENANHDQQAALALAANGDFDEREYVVELFVPEFTRGLNLDDCGGRLGPLSDHTESHYARPSLPLRWAFHMMKVSLKRLSSYLGYRYSIGSHTAEIPKNDCFLTR